jgi:hypothetical protein
MAFSITNGGREGMNSKIQTTALMVASSALTLLAEPGGTYTLTDNEQSIAAIIQTDMKLHPELYKGETFKNYLAKFKLENKIGRRKFKPGDQLLFPETEVTLQQKAATEPPTGEALLHLLAPKLRVESHGFDQRDNRTGNAVYVELNEKVIYSKNSNGNLHMICINQNGLVNSYGIPFHVEEDVAKEYAERLIDKMESCPSDCLVILGVSDTAHTYSPYMRKISKSIGGKADELAFRQSYVCIGYPGAKRGSAIEVIGGQASDKAAIFSGDQPLDD